MAPPSRKKAKKPVQQPPTDDEEEEGDIKAAAAAEAASPPNNVVDGISPPGMRMRSGKKKRRRSVEEKKDREPDPKRKRLAPEDKKEKEKEESGSEDMQDMSSSSSGNEDDAVMGEAPADGGSGGGGDDDDDEGDEDETMESEEEDGKMPAVENQQQQTPSNGSRRGPQNQNQATATAPTRGGQQRVALKKPSQQTPARIREKERKREQQEAVRRAAAAAASSSPTQDEIVHPGRKLQLAHQPETHQPSATASSEPPKIQRGGAPILENGDRDRQEQEQQQLEERELEEEEEVARPSSLLRIGMCCLAWSLLLAIACHLFESVFVEIPANLFLDTYQSRGWLEQPPEDLHDVQARLKDKLNEFNAQDSKVKNFEERFASELAEFEKDRQLFLAGLEKRKQELEDTTPKVESLVALLEDALEKDEMWSESLHKARDVLGDEDPLLDLSFIEDWNFPGSPKCNKPSEVGLDEFTARAEKLKEQALGWAQKATENPEVEKLVRKWLRVSILDEIPEYENVLEEIGEAGGNEETKTVVDADTDATTTQAALKRASLEDIQKTIRARFELERADQTGHNDYASILNGGAIIRTGDRATTASLVDDMPVLNRMAALLSLRFYGYGPEAAITPTHPPTALGQCWAFQNHAGKKNSALSVRLAKPIRVQRISIEHPPMEVSDRTGSAIRTFQVIGFEDIAAEGKPWVLGSFEYQRGHEVRQEFQAADHVKGEKVPVLRSISLSIFSNWGMEYSCLYRVRVFGRES